MSDGGPKLKLTTGKSGYSLAALMACPDCGTWTGNMKAHHRGRRCHAFRIRKHYDDRGFVPVGIGWAWFLRQLGVEAYTDVSVTNNATIVQACYAPAVMEPVLSLWRPASGKPGKTKERALMPYARVAMMCAKDPVVRAAFEASERMGTRREFVETIGRTPSSTTRRRKP